MENYGILSESGLDSETELLCKILDEGSVLTEHDFTGINWVYFLTVLETHRIANTVYIDGRILPYLPTTIKEKLQEKQKVSQFRMLGYMAELHRVISLFAQHSIPSIVLKGPALSQAYYTTPTQRESKDLDILVKPSDFQKAFDTLILDGYQVYDTTWHSPRQQEVYMNSFHHCGLNHPTRHTHIELHWKLYTTKRVSPHRIVQIWEKRKYQKVGKVDIPVLSRKDTFIYLCVHGGGYTHQWKRLFWVQDIAYMIRQEGLLFVGECYQYSKQFGAECYVLEACLLAHLIFKIELPYSVNLAIRNNPTITVLSRVSLSTIRNAPNSDLSRLPSWPSLTSGLLTFRRIYHLEGFSAFFSMFKRGFIYPEGWQSFSFSDRLFALNYLIAPFQRLYFILKNHNLAQHNQKIHKTTQTIW